MIQKEDLKDLFAFNRRERNGIWVLLCMIFLVWIGNKIYNAQSISEVVMNSQFDEEVRHYLAESNSFEKSNNSYKKSGADQHFKKKTRPDKLFKFDPNNLSMEKWMELGLSKRQIRVIENYLDKGGSFRVKSDLKKIYSISNEMYSRLKPFVDLPDSLDQKGNNNWSYEKKRDLSFSDNEEDQNTKFPPDHNEIIVQVEINSADSSELIRLKGIGPYYAGKIIEYRNKLGGYSNLNQLNEIYNMRSETLELIVPRLIVNSDLIQQLRINRDEVNTLKAHPYLNYKQAQAIVNYRKQHGAYSNIEDLSEVILLSDQDLLKLEPYLCFDVREDY